MYRFLTELFSACCWNVHFPTSTIIYGKRKHKVNIFCQRRPKDQTLNQMTVLPYTPPTDDNVGGGETSGELKETLWAKKPSSQKATGLAQHSSAQPSPAQHSADGTRPLRLSCVLIFSQSEFRERVSHHYCSECTESQASGESSACPPPLLLLLLPSSFSLFFFLLLSFSCV